MAGRLLSVAFVTFIASVPMVVFGQGFDRLTGTLVVAVPAREGLVVCSDKRLFNHETRTFTDSFVKIRKVSDNALFVATHTIGFFDRRSGKTAFDAYEITAKYAAAHRLSDGKPFWDGLKREITNQLRGYLAKRKFAEWPEADKQNSNLLFNLLFYSVKDGRAWHHSVKVFYEKARTPVIYVSGPVMEEVRTPKLGGKGKELLAYLARNPQIARDPLIARFDQTNFVSRDTTAPDAVGFARKLFDVTSAAVPEARVSPAFDCALLSYQSGFQWLPVGSK